MPSDFTAQIEAAAGLNSFYKNLVLGGFTTHEALYLLAALVLLREKLEELK